MNFHILIKSLNTRPDRNSSLHSLPQELILSSHMGVSRLMDVLVDTREVLRNDALLLLIQLTKGNANLQKIVAFENAFDKLADILARTYIWAGGLKTDCRS